jgi:hypothetical protein
VIDRSVRTPLIKYVYCCCVFVAHVIVSARHRRGDCRDGIYRRPGSAMAFGASYTALALRASQSCVRLQSSLAVVCYVWLRAPA